MVKKSVIKEIDKTIKEIWKENIQKDYWNDYLDREDTLKCALYYHMRKKLSRILQENNLRIYTEYTFSEPKYRADIIIVEIDPNMDYDGLDNAVVSFVALFELKFTSGNDIRTEEWVKKDFWKFKDYLNRGGLSECQFYFATVYEVECKWLNWLDARSTNHWALGRVTELDSGYIDGNMIFEVHSYNGMNKFLNDEGLVSLT